MRPVGYIEGTAASSPIFNYPYSVSRRILHELSKTGDLDDCHGYKMKFTNPVSGGWAMPTIAACMQFLPAGFASSRYRATDGTVFFRCRRPWNVPDRRSGICMERKGHFAVPSWIPIRHFAGSDAILFSFSDRAAQEKLGIWREQRGDMAVCQG